MDKIGIVEIDDEIAWHGLGEQLTPNLYNSWGWGDYKKQKGWQVKRVAILEPNSSQPLAVAQVQEKKKLFGPKLNLVQGGPVSLQGSRFHPSEYLPALVAALELGNLDIAIFQPYQALNKYLAIALMEAGCFEIKPKGSYTFKIDLRSSTDDLIANMSHNWRHNLKRSKKKQLEVRWVPSDSRARKESFAKLSGMYDYLTARKGFDKAIDPLSFAETFANDPNLEMVEVLYEGRVIAGRVGYHCKSHMLDVLAASTEEAKNTYASYLALWSLIERAKENGATHFDCGGIDPERNSGVFNFKKGLNGELESSASLWVYSPSSLMTRLVMITQT